MSLENNIVQLNASVDALTAEMIRMREGMNDQQRIMNLLLDSLEDLSPRGPSEEPEVVYVPVVQVEDLTIEDMEAAVEQALEKNPEPVVEQKEEAGKEVVVSFDDLMNLCLKTSRNVKDGGDKVRTIVRRFGGEKLQDINPNKYSDLYNAIKELEA